MTSPVCERAILEPRTNILLQICYSRSSHDVDAGFFHGLQISGSDGIVLGQRDGRATGEALVTFTSPAEAQRAMSKNNTYLGSRYIELFAT